MSIPQQTAIATHARTLTYAHDQPDPQRVPRRFGASATSHDALPNDVPHFWDSGPGLARPLASPYTRLGVRYTHRQRWFLDRVDGATRADALRAIHAYLGDPRSWRRAGIAFVRTHDRAQADILLRVIPRDTTVCGAGTAGCWSWSGRVGDPQVAEVGVEYLADPVAFGTILGMELCWHPQSGLDMYNAKHQPYRGSVGTFAQARAVGGWPTDAEIAALVRWLRGESDPRHIHDD